MEFPPRYPYEPPKFRFLTKILHPNISNEGRICETALDPRSYSVNTQVAHLVFRISGKDPQSRAPLPHQFVLGVVELLPPHRGGPN